MKNLWADFRKFAVKGNPFEMAFAVMVGTSFGLIVNSITKDIFMPLIGYCTSGVDLKHWKYVLQEVYTNPAGEEVAEIAIRYGKTIELTFTFIIISVSAFTAMRTYNRIKSIGEDPEDETIETPQNIKLLKEQVDLLKEQNEKLNKLIERDASK